MDHLGELPSDALEDIAYLARSGNRVRILESLTTRPYPRRELEEMTETSKATVSRILGEFEERGWTERNVDGEYEATARGKHVVAEFVPLIRSMKTIRSLEEYVALLPAEELSIDLRHFRHATIRPAEPNERISRRSRHLAEFVREATTFRALTWVAPAVGVGNAIEDGVLAGRLTLEAVHADGLDDYIRDNPEGPPRWPEVLDAGARLYRYDGHLPCNLFITDETVFIENGQVDGIKPGSFLESQNETVREWAIGLFEQYRRESEELGSEAFS